MPVYWYGANNALVSAGANLNNGLSVAKLAMTWLGADPSLVSDISTITSNSTKEETLINVIFDTSRKAVLQDGQWQFAKRHFQLCPEDGYVESYFNNLSIAGITRADPAVITTTANHNFKNGWTIFIDGVAGMTQINNRSVRCNNANGATFEAYGLSSISFNAYTSGGNCVRREPYADYKNGYVYRVPPDFIKHCHAENRPQYEVIGAGNSRRIMCSAANAVIEYIADIDIVTEMSEEFKRAWAARMAAELAAPLQKEGSARKDMWGFYKEVLERESQPADAAGIDPQGVIENKSSVLDAGGFED